MNKVLVVEDDTNIRNNISEILELKGYLPKTAIDGVDAITILENYMPDLIISDILMPNLTGFELKQYLQANDALKKIPFVFLSAKTDLRDIRHGMNIGADDYLTKPFSLQDLLDTIKVRLDKKRQNAPDEPLTFQESEIAELKQKLNAFSSSEKKVLGLLAQNFSSVEIGKKLFLSTKTIQNHRANMVRKAALTGTNSLLDLAIRCSVCGLL